MAGSAPLPLEVILWPLMGAGVALSLSRVLPPRIIRLVALVSAAVGLIRLWALRAGPADAFSLTWEPFTFLRTGPALRPTELGLFAAILLAAFACAAILGIRGSTAQRGTWPVIVSLALAGCLIITQADNLLTLALGSAAIDLALLAMAISLPEGVTWRMAVPGMASTLALCTATVWMDATVGTTSLLAREVPAQAVTLIGIAGALRLMVFPLQPRGLNTPEQGALALLPAGGGIYLLARAQSLAPLLAEQPWWLLAGSLAVLVGGWQAWASIGRREADDAEQGRTWVALFVHQVGLAVVYGIVWGAAAPWPLISGTAALGMLAVWWDGSRERQPAPQPAWLTRVEAWLEPSRTQARAWASLRLPGLERWRGSWLARRGAVLIPLVALASLAGIPGTAGAVTRWHLYSRLLGAGMALPLLSLLVADSLLVAGLGKVLRRMWRLPSGRRIRPGSLLALLGLALLLVWAGVAARSMASSLGLQAPGRPDVSWWGLGLTFVLPWLLGAWLARATGRATEPLEPVRRLAGLGWLYSGIGWAGRRLVDAAYWVGTVGEGEGWWGWALIILAAGTLFALNR